MLALVLFGCKKEGCTNPLASNYNNEAQKDDGSCIFLETSSPSYLTIQPMFNSEAIQYDTLKYIHPLGYEMSISTLKFFVSDIVLYKLNGDSIVLNSGHYFDCREGPSVVNFSNMYIPDGQYTGVSFDFGLNENYTTGYFNNPPESIMEWPVPMGGGYHYMKFEGYYDSSAMLKSYALHTGPLNGNPYHFRVVLDHAFSMSDGDLTIAVKMNLENWLQDPNNFDFNTYGSAIMGNPTAQTVLMQNGHNVFTVVSIN